jgi:FkbM family methyltransferase
VNLTKSPIVVPYVNGTTLLSTRPYTSVTQCVFLGLGEFEDMSFFLHALREDDIFCDVGANAGVYTVLASGAVGAQTVAFEPVPSTYKVLRDNIRVNDLDEKTTAHCAGLGSVKGSLRFTSGLYSYNHVAEPGFEGDTVEVPVDTLDHALDGRVPWAIKMDVEGFEYEVLKGAENTLSSKKLEVVLLEMSNHVQRYGSNENEIMLIMKEHGFGTYKYDPFKRNLIPLAEKNETYKNTIFIRNLANVSERIRTGPKVTVRGVTF